MAQLVGNLLQRQPDEFEASPGNRRRQPACT
jgi:hypothetical protein